MNLVRTRWSGLVPTDLKQWDYNGDQVMFGRTRRETIQLDDADTWGRVQVKQECVSELQNLLIASYEVGSKCVPG